MMILGLSRPKYRAEIPSGNDGLGTLLLGITGDEVLTPDVYNMLKTKALSSVRGTVQPGYFERRQQNTCIFSLSFH